MSERQLNTSRNNSVISIASSKKSFSGHLVSPNTSKLSIGSRKQSENKIGSKTNIMINSRESTEGSDLETSTSPRKATSTRANQMSSSQASIASMKKSKDQNKNTMARDLSLNILSRPIRRRFKNPSLQFLIDTESESSSVEDFKRDPNWRPYKRYR